MAGELQALTHIALSWGVCICADGWVFVCTYVFQLVLPFCTPGIIKSNVEFTQYVPFLYFSSLQFPTPPSPSPWIHFSHPLCTSHTLRQQHSIGAFQLPRRRQIKQGSKGELSSLSLFIWICDCLLSGATRWEAWNEKSSSFYWGSCSVERTGYSGILFSFTPAGPHSKQCTRIFTQADRALPRMF